jgi:orotate phosphoribosyltransferase
VIVDRATGAKERVESEGLEYRTVYGLGDLGLS